MTNWTAEVWIAAIGGATAILTAAIAMLKPKREGEPKTPAILVRLDADHVPTSRVMDDIKRIADASSNKDS
jgi:hypothetical protein